MFPYTVGPAGVWRAPGKAERMRIGLRASGTAALLALAGVEAAGQLEQLPGGGALYGKCVALSGDLALVGSGAQPPNSLTLLRREGGAWSTRATFSSGAFGLSGLGPATASEGDRFVLTGSSSAGPSAAVVRVAGDDVSLVGTVPVGDEPASNFGSGVLLVGDTLFVADYGAPVWPDATGAVFVYGITDEGCTLRQTLSFNEGDVGAAFGNSIAFDQGVLYVASAYAGPAPFDPEDPGAQSAHSAIHVFEFDGASFVETRRLIPEALPDLDETFGESLAVVGRTAFVGMSTSNRAGRDSGMVRVLDIGGDAPVEFEPLIAGAGEDIRFGRALAVVDDALMVLARPNDLGPLERGSLHTFRDLGGRYAEIAPPLVDPGSGVASFFGSSLGVSGAAVAVGSVDSGGLGGSAYVAIPPQTSAEPTPRELMRPADDAVISGAAEFAWTRAYAIVGNRLRIAFDPELQDVAIEREAPSWRTEYTLSPDELQDGRRYFWNVFAVTGGGSEYAFGPAARTFRIPLVADVNNDCEIDFDDLNGVLATYGQSGEDVYGDANGDGVTDFADINRVLSSFGRSCDP